MLTFLLSKHAKNYDYKKTANDVFICAYLSLEILSD